MQRNIFHVIIGGKRCSYVSPVVFADFVGRLDARAALIVGYAIARLVKQQQEQVTIKRVGKPLVT